MNANTVESTYCDHGYSYYLVNMINFVKILKVCLDIVIFWLLLSHYAAFTVFWNRFFSLLASPSDFCLELPNECLFSNTSDKKQWTISIEENAFTIWQLFVEYFLTFFPFKHLYYDVNFSIEMIDLRKVFSFL